ncbi:hypothetical protein [Halobaculum halobium]|uniref:Uncharacterized protein n=1 Tax=Halobaculum halobium TaxID=3032281 RepID=A0ABD5TER4_9EURY|nr:hypothetical protein [Halobaculum sp. SYNS20]
MVGERVSREQRSGEQRARGDGSRAVGGGTGGDNAADSPVNAETIEELRRENERLRTRLDEKRREQDRIVERYETLLDAARAGRTARDGDTADGDSAGGRGGEAVPGGDPAGADPTPTRSPGDRSEDRSAGRSRDRSANRSEEPSTDRSVIERVLQRLRRP